MKTTLFASALFISTLLPRPLPAQHQPISSDAVARYDAYVQQAVRAWRVPGLTVTVVKDGQVLLKRGYGVREMTGVAGRTAAPPPVRSDKPEPVNSQTLFAMASTTKAMTAACLGMLVDEGKLRWDDPVTNYLPGFQLYDPAVTRDLRVRDLLTHNAGLGNADFLWTAMQIPADEMLHRLRLLKPTYSLRAGFIYQNIMYVAAGKVIEKVSGLPWETFIRRRIFEPLGMHRTRALFRDVTDANRAKPHLMRNDTVRLVDSRAEEGAVDAVGPAGSVWSCPDDLVAWMQCMLDTGRYSNGNVLLKPATWAELFRPQTLVPDDQFYPTQQLTKPNWKTYSLGWFQHDYRGQRVNFHTGSLTGMVAIHGQLPDQKLAVYVQGNLDHAELRHALMYRAFDEFGFVSEQPAGAGAVIGRDWSAEFRQLYGNLEQRAKRIERSVDSLRVMSTKPSLPLTAYAGSYADPLYGKAEVTLKDDKLRIILNSVLAGNLTHWHFDTFRLTYDQFWNGTDTVGFVLDAQGKVAKLSWGGAELTKVPERAVKGVAER